MGIVLCTQRAVRSMRERKFDGHVVLINSILGHKTMSAMEGVVPDVNVYPPSKHAVTALAEGYRQEFLGLGTRIKITVGLRFISSFLIGNKFIGPYKVA